MIGETKTVQHGSLDQEMNRQAQDVLANKSTRRGWQRITPFLGAAFVASVAYMDPGNFATNISGGA